MSKIGKINIKIPEKIKVVMAGNALNIEGPLGKKTLSIDTTVFDMDIKEGKEISKMHWHRASKPCAKFKSP